MDRAGARSAKGHTTWRYARRAITLRAAGVSALLVASACGFALSGLGPSVSDSDQATTREDAAHREADADPPSSETAAGDDAASDTADAAQLSEDATAEAGSDVAADGSARDAQATAEAAGDATADGSARDVQATADGSARDTGGTDGDAQPSDGASDVTPGGPPPTIMLGAAAPTAKQGGAGGSPNVDACPASQMVIGFVGTYDPAGYVDSIQVVCGMVRVTGSGTYQVVVSPGVTLPSRGTTGVSAFAARCPNNQVVAGFYGHSGVWMDQVGFDCAPLTISQNGTYAIATGAITQLPASGGPGGMAFGDPCPNGQVAAGSDIGSGLYVDSIDLLCATPMLMWPDK